jgi:hypothetical protein
MTLEIPVLPEARADGRFLWPSNKSFARVCAGAVLPGQEQSTCILASGTGTMRGISSKTRRH